MAVVRKTSRASEDSSSDGEDHHREDGDDELDLLEKVVKKLARITALFTKRNVMDKTEMANMDDASKGYILEVMRAGDDANDEDDEDTGARPSPLKPHKPQPCATASA